jgi:hypothetical protein
MARKKKSEELTEREIEARAALAARDTAVMQKEWALAPYNLGKLYDLGLRVQQAKWLLKQEVGIRFALGCILMEIKEHENLQTFAKILGEEFGGMAQRTAYNYMLFAKKCVDLPKLKSFAEDNWSKALVLMHSCTEDELKELEDKGLDGRVLDDMDGMSVRQLKAALRKHKHETDKIVRAETHALKVEKDALIKENEQLRAFSPESKDMDWSMEQTKEIEAALNGFDVLLRRFAFDERILGHPELQALVEGVHRRMEARLKHFISDWDARVTGEDE